MTSAELAVTAALGASFLTGLASLGVVAFQQWLAGRSSDADALISAVNEMLSRSMAIAMRAQAMADQMRIRSGLGEGVDVTMRVRKPADLLELHDWMAQDLAPMNAAWSVVWARGDQEMVRRANALLAKCSDLIGAGTTTQAATSYRERIRRYVIGERWTDKERGESQQALKDVAHARKDLAEYARQKLGKRHAELFTHDEIEDINGNQ